MRRRQFLPAVAAASVPLAGCSAPVTTRLSDPDVEVQAEQQEVHHIYHYGGERALEFSVSHYDYQYGSLRPLQIHLWQWDRTKLSSIRYEFATSVSRMRPTVYLEQPSGKPFPPIRFTESSNARASVFSIADLQNQAAGSFTLDFLVRADETPFELTIDAEVELAEKDGIRRYTAEPRASVDLS